MLRKQEELKLLEVGGDLMQGGGTTLTWEKEEFTIASEFAGLAIGARGKNLQRVRGFDGVKSILIQDNPEKQLCTIKVRVRMLSLCLEQMYLVIF